MDLIALSSSKTSKNQRRNKILKSCQDVDPFDPFDRSIRRDARFDVERGSEILKVNADRLRNKPSSSSLSKHADILSSGTSNE